MAEKVKKSKYLLHFSIMVLITAIFFVLPGFASITPYGMKVLGIFIALIYGWSVMETIIPSLFAIVAISLTEYGNTQTLLANMFSNSTVLIMLVSLIAFMAISQTGAGDWMLAKILGSKLVKKSPSIFIMMLFVAFFFGFKFGIVMFLYFVILPLLNEMILKCGYEKGDKFNFLFLTGALTAGMLGMCFFPFGGWGLMSSGTLSQLTQVPCSYPGYIAMVAIISILFIVTYPFFMKLCGCDLNKLASVDIEETFGQSLKSGKITIQQKIALFSLIVFIFIVLIANIFPNITICAWINSTYGMVGCMTILWFFVVSMKIDGKSLLDMRKAAADFQWDMLLLIGVALVISGALTSEQTGISVALSKILMPIFSGKGPIFILIVIAIATTILTNIGNNTVMLFLVINLSATLYNNGLDFNITAAGLIIAITSTFVAYLTPASSMPGAIIHSLSCMKSTTAYKWTPILAVYALIIVLVVVIPYSLFAA